MFSLKRGGLGVRGRNGADVNDTLRMAKASAQLLFRRHSDPQAAAACQTSMSIFTYVTGSSVQGMTSKVSINDDWPQQATHDCNTNNGN